MTADVPFGPVPRNAAAAQEKILSTGVGLPNTRKPKTFENRDGLLPEGEYTEWYVNRSLTKAEKEAGLKTDGERLVISADQEHVYYTSNHYESFTEVPK